MSKRDAILEAALGCFATEGINATATATIAKSAGVATGTLFHHFKDKNALILAVYDKAKTDFSAHLEEKLTTSGQDIEPLIALWQNALSYGLSHPEWHRFLERFYASKFASAQSPLILEEKAPWIWPMVANQLTLANTLKPVFFHYLNSHFLATITLLKQRPIDEHQAIKTFSFTVLYQGMGALSQAGT